MVGQQILDLPIGVRVPAPQQLFLHHMRGTSRRGAGPTSRMSGFDSLLPYHAHVAQLAEASDLDSEGWGFKSLREHYGPSDKPAGSWRSSYERVVPQGFDSSAAYR